MANQKQPIGVKTYLKIVLPFAITGFLIGAWICRSPEALAAFEARLTAKGILNVTSTNTPEDFRTARWCYVGVLTVLGMLIGECVRPFIRKGPIF